MRILYISQYYYPEVCAPVNRARANAEYFASVGHNVTVLTEMPNHPQGIVFPNYKGKIFKNESIGNCSIARVCVFTSKKKNFITRLLFYFSFAFTAGLYSVLNYRKYDVVYITSPPLFVSLIGIVLKIINPKKKIIFEVRDLWPDSAIQLGELRNKFIIKISKKIEIYIYRYSDKIISISEHMKEAIIQKGIKDEKITVIHNGTDFNYNISDLKEFNIDVYQKLKNKKVILYAGNVGIAQNLDILIEAAELLKDKHEYYFLIVGDGPRRMELEALKEKRLLDNIEFIGEISREEIPNYLAQADCGIVPLRKLSLFYGALPSKMFDYMACGLPILVGINGEAKEMINKSKTGLYYEPENARDLTVKIRKLLSNNETLETYSNNAVNFVSQNFTRINLTKKLEAEIFTKDN